LGPKGLVAVLPGYDFYKIFHVTTLGYLVARFRHSYPFCKRKSEIGYHCIKKRERMKGGMEERILERRIEKIRVNNSYAFIFLLPQSSKLV